MGRSGVRPVFGHKTPVFMSILSSSSGPVDPTQTNWREIEEELVMVESELQAGLADLQPPFSQLAQSQLKRGYPLMRAAIVLASGVGAPDTESLRSRRVYLGAALEMLYLALGIHARLLVKTSQNETPNQSVLGSTVLAGDYCFSRAAGLAVCTESSRVVEIFAQALKRVSEGHLRQLFHSEAQPYDENRELFLSGVSASGELAGLSPDTITAAVRFADVLAIALNERHRLALDPDEALTSHLDPVQSERWVQLLAWLQAHAPR